MVETATSDELRNRRNRLYIVGGIVAVILVGVVISSGGDDGPSQPGPPAASPFTVPSTAATTPAAQPDSEVPPIDCNRMIMFDEVDEALGGDDNPALGSGSSTLSLNEECTHTAGGDERYFVQISPSGPSDFEPTAQLLGVASEPVDGVGVRAVWFGGDDSESGGDSGVIAVEETTEHGRLFVRIFLGRPDVGESEQREIAAGLARLALTRFPGVAPNVEVPPVPEVVVFEEAEPPDTSGRSLGDNLLAREAAGDWTRAEGLVASLRYLAGEVDATEVPSTDELEDTSATVVIWLAREQLDNDPDGPEAAEIERLLDLLTSFQAPEPVAAGRVAAASHPLAWALALAQDGPDPPADPCLDGQPTDSCTEYEVRPRPGVPDDKYRLFVDVTEGSAWTNNYIAAAVDAILDTAVEFEQLGEMPQTIVVLHRQSKRLFADVGRTGDDCTLFIGEEIAAIFEPNTQFRQLVAREMAYCLIATEFRELIGADFAGVQWWARGLATYLSGVVYPNANTEYRTLPAQLANEELETTIVDRTWSNWALFEYLHATIGAEGNLANISGFPVGGDHGAALAAYPDMAEQFHGFNLALTDADLDDIGNGTVPYVPRDWDLDIVVPVTAELAVDRFGIRRIAITVPEGRRACFGFTESGDPDVSWRPGVAGERGQWNTDRPDSLVGESMLVITTVTELARFELTVDRLVDEDEDCTEDTPPPTTLGVCDIGCGPSRYYYQ